MLPLIHCLLLVAGPVQERRAVDPPSREETRAALASAAAAIESIEYGDVLHGRTGRRGTDAGEQRLAQLFARRFAPEALTALLADPEAHIRTLALLALYDREDPRLLPQMAALAADEAPSFPEPQKTAALLPQGEKTPCSPRTVGWCARQLVENYLHQAGFEYGIEGVNDHPGFTQYWAARKERSFCASWFLLRQLRASGAASPFQKNRTGNLRLVRAEVDRLPAADRALMLLWLPDVEGNFATEAERVDAARSLGRDKLLGLLRREVPSDDPDLQPNSAGDPRHYPCAGIVRFVLMRAHELLAPEDAPTLLALGGRERASAEDDSYPAMRTVWWDIAAASLAPASAADCLESAFGRVEHEAGSEATVERCDLLIAYWRARAPNCDAWIAQRFYAETLEGDFTPPARTRLFAMLAKDGSERARGTLAALVRDPGFAELDAGTLRELAQAVDGWTKPPLFAEHELWELSHPLGEWSLRTKKQLEAAARLHPEATRKFLATLESWRTRITASLSNWAPPVAK